MTALNAVHPTIQLLQTNLQIWQRISFCMSDALLQLIELNRKTVDAVWSDGSIEVTGQAPAIEQYQAPLFARWPTHAVNYIGEAMATLSAATSDLSAALTSPIMQPVHGSKTPRLLLAAEEVPLPTTATSFRTSIVDSNGTTI